MLPATTSPLSSETVAEQFMRAHQDFADHPALLCDDRWWSFAEVGEVALRAVGLLAQHGAEPGDRIVLFLENSAVLRIMEHGILSAGLVRVALSSRLNPREVASIAADCSAAVVCCSPKHEASLREALAEILSITQVLVLSDDEGGITPDALAALSYPDLRHWPRPKPADTAMLMYSSGTTGRPKGAIVRHSAWIAQTRLSLAQLPRIGVGDVVLAVAPMAHFGGSIGLNCAIQGAATVTMNAFDAATSLEGVIRHGVTVLPLVPVMLKSLVEDASPSLQLSASTTLRAIPYGGSPTDTGTLVASALSFPHCLVQYYGLSEALAPLSSLGPEDHDMAAAAILSGEDAIRARRIIESAGRPVAGVELRFGDDTDSNDSATSGIGEISVRGPVVTAGYWNRPDLTVAALDPDGWFSTGDLGELDSDGYLHLLDRKNDVIISGGYNVYPGEVERAIGALENVDECVVFGVPHPRWGEGVHALVLLAEDAGDEPREVPLSSDIALDILNACRRNLAGFKKPTSIEIVPRIPRTAAGKIDRKRLLAEYLERRGEERC